MYPLLPLLLLLPAVHSSCIHNTHLYPRASSGPVEISTFSYLGASGPLNWASLSPSNSACSTSRTQSPINLTNATSTLLPSPPAISIPSLPSAEFENLGTTVEVICTGTTTLAGTEFKLKQFHLHSPSEHRINEEYFPLEMHMVHESSSGGIAVIAVLFELSSSNTTSILSAVTENIDAIAKPGTRTETGPLDFSPLIKHIQNSPLMTYKGSLTTPPCAEGLTFIIPQQPMPVDVETFNKIKKVVRFNSRYTQNNAGEENVLEQGCRAVENARGGGGAGGNATATATEKKKVEASASATAPVGADASATHHCIMGACHTVLAPNTRRGRRWFGVRS
ncbi:carbonic anhydrase [Wilcoxina mikolae CBS 423.85]|nr:carbonic anhydrase [Wilcoxina mikolae CBS 423.85]